MKIADYLSGKTVFITGATGFLGQPLVEKILWAAPDVRRVYVLIRPKRQFGGRVSEAAERLERELYSSTVLDRLLGRYQDELQDFLQDKIRAVNGDIAQERLGIDPERLESLRQEVDIVINSAAVVSFDAPLDESLELNVFGARRVAEFAAGCDDAVLVHVSTAYVCGAADGEIPEALYHVQEPGSALPLPRRIASPEAEIEQLEATIAEVRAEAATAGVQDELEEILRKRERRRGDGQKARREEKIEGLRRRWLASRLTAAGMKRARSRGWNDTYTYTKAIGEQVVVAARGDMPTAIIRPSVIESSLSEPSPGWLDGLRMADPLIVAIGKGRLRALPLNPKVCLDLVPVDMVVNATLAALPRLQDQSEVQIYQVATANENPINLQQLYELIHEYFSRNPMLNREGTPIQVKRLRFPKPGTFRLQYRLRTAQLDTAEKTLQRLPILDRKQKARRRLAARRAAYQKLYYYGEIYEPYLNLNCRFQVDRSLELLESLDSEDRRQFNFDVRRLNWRHYIQNVHIPGVKKYILKIEGMGTLALEEEEAELPAATIPELVRQTVERTPDKVALRAGRSGDWTTVTYRELWRRSGAVAAHLAGLGLRKGDRVVLFAENRPEWGIAYLGASRIGLTVVPIDVQTWSREVWSVAEFTSARSVLATGKALARLTPEQLQANEQREEPLLLLNVEDEARPFDMADYPRSSRRAVEPVDLESLPAVGSDDEASVIFTTGTSVDPRGAVHTHRNFLNNLVGVNHYLAVSPHDEFLSVLPLYHALEFSCGFLMPLHGGATVTYAPSLKPRVLLETMRETGTTCMLGVPTLFALIRDDIERRVMRSGKSALKSNIMQTSKQLSRSVERHFGRNIGRSLFARVHKEFGGRIRVFVSGGSSLGRGLYQDYQALGMPIYEGYGLTETAPVLTVNPLHRSREGSAGQPLPGIELRLFHPDEEGVGEIMVRTPALMKQYFRNEEATSAVSRDGWFHTGDLGWVDTDGYVYITGRTKDVIVTGAGKNVYPTDLEAIYHSCSLVEDICVIGVKSGLTEDVHAAIQPSGELSEDEPAARRRAVQRQVQQLARELPSYNRLQAIHLFEDGLPRTADGALDRVAVRQAIERLAGQVGGDEGPRVRRPERRSRSEQLMLELSRLSGETVEEITRESHLYGDLGLDSLMALELLLFIEQQFGVTVDDERVTQFQTVGDILDELQRRSSSTDGVPAPTLQSALTLQQRGAADRAMMRSTLGIVRTFFRGYLRLSVQGAERLPRSGAFILAANHNSHLDTGAVFAALQTARGAAEAQRLHVIGARDYFFDSTFKSWFFSRCLNVVPIEREEISLAGLRLVRSILRQGEPVLIFPEGTRSRNGYPQPFKPGIGLLAWEVQVPIVPVRIQGTRDALPPGASRIRRHPVSVTFGEALQMSHYGESDGRARDDLYRRITRDAEQAVFSLPDRPA